MDLLPLDLVVSRLRRVQSRGGLSLTCEGVRDWYEVMLFPPAAEGSVNLALAAVGRPLPEDFLRFWRLTNGANLFVNESGLHGVGVASTDRIAELLRDEEAVYGCAAMASYSVFARVNGAGSFLVFDLQTGQVLDGVHAEQPHEWRPIAESFTAWIGRFLEARGRYFWIEDLYETHSAER